MKSATSLMPPSTLDDLLAPSTSRRFLESQFGKTFVHFPGTCGRFSSLFPWNELNKVLRQHRLDTPRLRVIAQGKQIATDKFLTYQTSRSKLNSRIPHINHIELTRFLRQGATLIVDAVDEVYDPVTTLTENLRSLFRVRIQANLYAGWRTSHGFDIHWDDHDVIIVQVSGRKQWKIFEMTRPFPLARDIEPNTTIPDTPLWEGVLNDGDALYIPRGWWHVAVPLDEPTLHLTLGIRNPRGVDMLSWFSNRLRANEDVRRDLPRFDPLSDRAAYMERLRRALLEAWTPELLEEYFSYLDIAAPSRPHFGFPWSATEQVLPESGFVRWASPLPVSVMPINGPGEFSIECIGQKWRFAEAARPIIELLTDRKPHAIAELERVSTDAKVGVIFLRELVSYGLLAVVESCVGE
jgi:hypothetical protein